MSNTEFELITIDPNAGDLTTALFITEERGRELQKILNARPEHIKNWNIGRHLEYLRNECKLPINEYAFCCLQLGINFGMNMPNVQSLIVNYENR